MMYSMLALEFTIGLALFGMGYQLFRLMGSGGVRDGRVMYCTVVFAAFIALTLHTHVFG